MRKLILLTIILLSCSNSMAWKWRASKEVKFEGETYVYLQDIANKYGMRYKLSKRQIVLSSRWSDLRFEAASRRTLLNGIQVWLHLPTKKIRKKWALTKIDAQSVIKPLLQADSQVVDQRARIVVLDPGHGGRDRGSRGKRRVEEKRVALDISKRMRTKLANEGLKVYLTRTGDRYLSLNERTSLAARYKADVFVSIHLNSSTSAQSSGFETFVLTSPGYRSTNDKNRSKLPIKKFKGNRFDGANAVLGLALHHKLSEKINANDRGLRRARFYVLKEAPCPAVLVECGFLSNKREEELFLEAKHREKFAQTLTEGIMEYIGIVNRAKLLEN